MDPGAESAVGATGFVDDAGPMAALGHEDPGPGGPPAHTLPDLALSVVVPAFNEAGRLADGVARLMAAVHGGGVDPARTEVVVVDDGSTDGTVEIARSLLSALPHLRVLSLGRNCGKGAAVRVGVAAARGPAVAFMDADMAIDPDQIPLLLTALRTEELAIGSRTQPGSVAEGATVTRTLIGRAFTAVVNLTTNVALGDTQCGFKGFRAPVARTLFHLTAVNGFAFDVEVLSVARRLGFGIAEVPVRWRHVPGSRIRPLADAVVMARDVHRGRRQMRGRPPIPTLALPAPSGNGSGSGSGSGSGRLAPGPVPGVLGLAVDLAGPSLPVLADGDGGALILFPLCRLSDLEAVAARVEAGAPGQRVRQGSITFAELERLAPLRFVTAPRQPSGEAPWGATAPDVPARHSARRSPPDAP